MTYIAHGPCIDLFATGGFAGHCMRLRHVGLSRVRRLFLGYACFQDDFCGESQMFLEQPSCFVCVPVNHGFHELPVLFGIVSDGESTLKPDLTITICLVSELCAEGKQPA